MKSVVDKTLAIRACVLIWVEELQGGVWPVEVVVAWPKDDPDDVEEDVPEAPEFVAEEVEDADWDSDKAAVCNCEE
jgi:hypothetical protein